MCYCCCEPTSCPNMNDLNPQFMPECVDIFVMESLYAGEMPTNFEGYSLNRFSVSGGISSFSMSKQWLALVRVMDVVHIEILPDPAQHHHSLKTLLNTPSSAFSPSNASFVSASTLARSSGITPAPLSSLLSRSPPSVPARANLGRPL